MYEAFYKLRADPFMMSPDHRFSYPHHSYTKARSHLEYGLLRGEGLVVVTGAPGMGKSTVISDVLEQYSRQHNIQVARLQTTQLETNDLLRMVAYSFGINADRIDKPTAINRIEEYLHQQYDARHRVLLIIDEAQHLNEGSLEELRLLTNIQRDSNQRFQIFLLGQPQLQSLVRGPSMEQLRQRIVAISNFDPLGEEETREFILHRLTVAGWEGDPEITGKAVSLIHRFSEGVPRRINMICSRLLLHGAVDEKHLLDVDDVRGVLDELPLEMTEDSNRTTRNPPLRIPGRGSKSIKKYERWYAAARGEASGKPSAKTAISSTAEEQLDIVAHDALSDTDLDVLELDNAHPETRSVDDEVDSLANLQDIKAPVRLTTVATREIPESPQNDSPTVSMDSTRVRNETEPRMYSSDDVPGDDQYIDEWERLKSSQSRTAMPTWVAAVLLFGVIFIGTLAVLHWVSGANGTVPDREVKGLSIPEKQPPHGQSGPDQGARETSTPVATMESTHSETPDSGSASGVAQVGGRAVISDEMEQALKTRSINVDRLSQSLRISLNSNAPFKQDSAQLLPPTRHSLEELARVLGHYNGFTVNVVAYSNDSAKTAGDESPRLSRLRARVIADYLIAHGLEGYPMRTEGLPADVRVGNPGSAVAADQGVDIYLTPVA